MKLSIITVNLNNAEGLKKTVESVISQTFTDFEFIIIDGASTDGSLEVVNNYQLSNLNFQLISEPDKGIFDAMNKGILLAKGDFCQFLNSGDYLYSTTVLEEVFSREYSDDIVTGNFIELYDSKTALRKGRAYARQQQGKPLTMLDLFAGSLSHQATFIRRELFDRYGLYNPEMKVASDWLFFLYTIGIKGVTVKYIDQTIVYFDMNGISNQSATSGASERMEALKSLLPPVIFEDYLYFTKIEHDFHYLIRYRLTYRIGRLINKLATAWFLFSGKIRALLGKIGFKIRHEERTF
ncbi:MAG: glycosyltransferase [Dysgonamonadaceae bacterium]|jgi:glycosyltransferase involved in cell wall biosynthesis|nr:glycosyltransferase [Dysgonamonadaceae bacterium]